MEKNQEPAQDIAPPPYTSPSMGVDPAQPGIQPDQETDQQSMPQQPQTVQPVNQFKVRHPPPTKLPGEMECPHCKTTVLTKTKYKNGRMVWNLCGVLGVCLCWPCCLIPFCVNSLKDVEHSCPTCNNVLHLHEVSKAGPVSLPHHQHSNFHYAHQHHHNVHQHHHNVHQHHHNVHNVHKVHHHNMHHRHMHHHNFHHH